VTYQARYIDNVKKVLKGDEPLILDTTMIEIPKDEFLNE
jgi:hypothetical protein